MAKQDFSEVFSVGAKVRCESEAFPGKWEYGVVQGHFVTRHCQNKVVRIQAESGELIDIAHWFLDSDPHNSLVRLVK